MPSTPLRLLHVVPTYLPAVRYGGPIVSVHGLCKALVRAGHDLHVFTTNVDGPTESPVPLGSPVSVDGVMVWYFPVPMLRRIYWSPRLAQALAAQVGEFDLLHLHSVFLWPTWAAAKAAKRSGIPYVVSPRGMLVKDLILRKSRWTKTAWIRLVERRNLENASAVHVTSANEAKALSEFHFALRRVDEMPNGVDVPPDDISASAGDTPSAKNVLYVGRINWKKGLDRLIRALAYLPGVRLAIAGNDEEGYTRQLQRIADEEKVSSRVEFLPAVYGADKWSLIRSAGCFVLPSYSENFGNAALEAMAAGCPVVVTPEVGVSDLVGRCGAGLVTGGEPASLARALSTLLADPVMRAEMGRAGKAAAIHDYGWDAVARRMASMYESLCIAARSRAGDA